LTGPWEYAGPSPAEVVLVVDLGTTTSSAIVLADGGRQLVKDPATGRDCWPTSVFDEGGQLLVGSAAEDRKGDNPQAYLTEFKPRLGSGFPVLLDGRPHTMPQLAAAVLQELRSAARQLGHDPRRLLITVPAASDDHQRAATLEASRLAGFVDVELLAEPVAAAHAPTVGAPWAVGDVVLVYDLGGGTFDAALIRVGDAGHEVLGQAGLTEDHGARAVDAALVQDFRPQAEAWLAARPDPAAERALLEQAAVQAAITLKHRLTAAEEARAYVSLGLPPMTANRDRLRLVTASLLRGTVECCLALIDRAGLAVHDLSGVLLVGGGSRMPVVAPFLSDSLGRPVHPAADTVLAVVEGAALWAVTRMPTPRTEPDRPEDMVRPLRWTLPGSGRAILNRWLVEPGDAYPAGTALARVRLHDGTLHDLAAREPGRVLRHHLDPGQHLVTGDWIVTSRRPPAPQEVHGLPRTVHAWPTRARALAHSPDGRRLAVAEQHSADQCAIRILDAHSADEIHVQTEQGRIRALAWAPSGRHLAYGLSARDETVRLLDLEEPTAPVWTVLLHGVAQGLDFVPDGRSLAAVCGHGSVRLINVRTGSVEVCAEALHWASAVSAHPDGRLLAVGGEAQESGSGVTLLMGPRDGRIRRELTHAPPVQAVRFSPDGRWLAAAGGESENRGFLHVYDTSDWSAVFSSTDRPSVRAVAFSPDSALLAAADVHGDVQVWSLHDQQWRATGAAAGIPVAIAFAPDGHRLVAGAEEGVRIWALTYEGGT
jgi:WD40 repeat protein/actin-like ATPase involved in cell morphogenesis